MTLLIAAFTISFIASAQILVTGIVTNDSISLESASVIIKNSTKGIATNAKGEFKLEAKKGDTLTISYLGYQSKEIVVLNNDELKIKMIDGGKLDEVIIEAYASYRRGCSGMSCKVTVIVGDFEKLKPKLFPNPSSNGIFQLTLNEDYDEVEISVSNISGRIIQNSTHQKFEDKVVVDLSQFSAGIYIVNIIANGGNRLEPIKALIN